ncbi:hypothetical protein [Ottowia sp.]|uniref:hypothetical protein n=1 Tax=Ottowia sp. TaxID=1898956 RepID=UPI003A884BC4
MNQFAHVHWGDDHASERMQLAVADDGQLMCQVGTAQVQGHASAPLLFVTGALAALYAHECEGRFGHRVDGRINRIWPCGIGTNVSLHRHDMDKEVRAWAAAWPGLLFSSSLYQGVNTPGHPYDPRSLEGAPRSTSLTGILKRVVKSAGDADPLERLKVAEFIEVQLRSWHSTAADRMMAVVGKPLMALVADPEPAIRELAVLALETCANHCWQTRAYGLYEPLYRVLAEAGFSAHIQYVRLAESAYAAGDLAEGDRLWAVATAGQDLKRPVKIGTAFDAIGDWNDLHTRLLRQAGGAHVAWSRGEDPNPPRHDKLKKKGIQPPDAKTAVRHRQWAATLLARAAEGADARLAIDLPAAEAGQEVPLGQGSINPKERRLFLEDIYFLQSTLAHVAGDALEELRLLFKAQNVAWRLQGEASPHWRWGNEDDLIALVAQHDNATLERLGVPAYLLPLIEQARQAAQLAQSDAGQEQLFWQRFMRMVREQFLRDKDLDYNPLPGDDLVPGFVVTRAGARMQIAHAALAQPVVGPLSTPVLNGLRAWHATLRAAHGMGAWFETQPYYNVTLGVEDIPVLAAMAAEALAAGAQAEAVALYRFAAGTDPLVEPWYGKNPVTPLPLEEVPEAVRQAVAWRSPLEDSDGHAKLKPRGRRIEQLAKDFAQSVSEGDAVTARYIGHCLRDACSAGGSEIMRALKSGTPLLLALWQHADRMVREMAILPIFDLLHMRSIYAHGIEVDALMAVAEEAGIADIAHLQPGSWLD